MALDPRTETAAAPTLILILILILQGASGAAP